jgi:putative oxidoreductase
MENQNSFFAQWSPRVLSILRIVVAFIFVAHGSQKLFGHPAMPSPLPEPPQVTQQHLPPLMQVAGWLELVGGLFILLGLFTRPVAFILSGEMAVAYFMGHASSNNWLWPMLNKGEPAVYLCFIFLYLAVAGGGTWSLDSLLRRK